MKKLTILGMAAIALLSSCSKDITLTTAPASAIVFNNAFVENSTRTAQDVTANNLTNAYVWGTRYDADGQNGTIVFNNTELTKGDPNWTYTNLQYWVAGNTYNFMAYAPKNDNLTLTASGTAAQVDAASFKLDNKAANGEVDFVYDRVAGVKGLAESNPAVAFTLEHMLSKVKFTITNGFPANSDAAIIVKDIVIKNTKDEMQMSLAGEWSATGVGTTFDMPFPIAGTQIAADGSLASEQKYLFPAASTDYTVSFTAELYQGGVKTVSAAHTATISSLALTAGHSYNITASLKADNINPDATLEPIKFTVSVTDWTTPDTDQGMTLNK